MQHGALLLMQAGTAMRDFPRERARNAQLEERNDNLMMELLKLKEKEAEWKEEIADLQLHNELLEGDLKYQIDQVKKLKAELKEMSEKKNQAGLDSANGATNTECEHCLEHITRINALTAENKKLQQRCQVLADAFAAGEGKPE
jgi:predicted nuclease with TOPRIM domain